MRAHWLVVAVALLGGCSFERPRKANADFPDAMEVDSDARVDSPLQMCTGYVTLPGAPAGSRYRMISTSNSFSEQSLSCASDSGYVVIANDATELSAIASYAPTRNGFYWTGISDAVVEGIWRTSKDAPASYLPWAQNQPDGGVAHNCALTSGGQFFDVSCDAAYPTVCECN
jgi:Lectin C-type domain